MASYLAGSEVTFRGYTDDQGDVYARARPGYRQDLYKIITDYHTSTGGILGTLLDIGCGAGTATRELGSYFQEAVGLDPSAGMIAAAKSIGGRSLSSPIRFDVSTDSELGSNLSPPVSDGSIDLVAAATAAQYFDMAAFWAAAARVLKPGGTVALWRGSFLHIHPSTPNHQRVQAALNELIDEIQRYKNDSSNNGGETFEALPLPWTMKDPVAGFDQESFSRKVWNEDGKVPSDEEFFLNHQILDLNGMEEYLATVSSTARWRQANPEAAGTERDVVKVFTRKVEDILQEAVVEEGEERITAGMSGVLLMVKKSN
ncbi:methyltransferase domain-containing protein [Colletotrichum plurivorum]|uniref:Methyltransferase domain-containing protein n=1 Tax=Colletotrichum plurivorum TaxID=2175906 RepID=A0A8H6N892_9PEZI|nr:methyltransferase domain-containing protein [Colletotrichum plurivorum]